MAMSRLTFVALFFFGLAASNESASSQSLGIVPGRDLPDWLETWSPLYRQGDFPRHLPSASVATPSLLLPVAKVGLFWDTRNPAALPWEVDDQRSDIAVAHASQEGPYRRPLDPAASSVTQFYGMGWQRVPTQGAVVGRATFDRNVQDPGSVSDVNEPYGSTPFVMTDTSTSALRQTRARLEGAGGWGVGQWGFGVALGYDTRNTATVASPFARRNRAVSSAGTVGIVRGFKDGKLKVGVRGTWSGGKETVNLFEFAQEGFLYLLEGYREVPGQDFIVTFQRQMTEETRSVGASVGGKTGTVKWVVFGDAAHFRQRLTSLQQDNPATDLWATTGGSGGLAFQFPLLRKRATLTFNGRVASLTGHAEQVLPPRTGFDAHERVLDLHTEFRLAPTNDWTAAVNGSLLAEHRERNDSIAKASTIVDGITPAIAVEIGRVIVQRLMIIGGYAIAGYTASGTIPSASSRGALYKRVFAPELEMATSDSRSQAASFAVRWQPHNANAVWIAGRYERLDSQAQTATFAPIGGRNAKSIWLGVTLAPPRR
jgi:hypothetical protein